MKVRKLPAISVLLAALLTGCATDTKINTDTVKSASGQEIKTSNNNRNADIATLPKGSRIYLEVKGSPEMTREFREQFAQLGYVMTTEAGASNSRNVEISMKYVFQKPQLEKQSVDLGKVLQGLADKEIEDKKKLQKNADIALSTNGLTLMNSAGAKLINTFEVMTLLADLTGARDGLNKAITGDVRGTCSGCKQWQEFTQSVNIVALVVDGARTSRLVMFSTATLVDTELKPMDLYPHALAQFRKQLFYPVAQADAGGAR